MWFKAAQLHTWTSHDRHWRWNTVIFIRHSERIKSAPVSHCTQRERLKQSLIQSDITICTCSHLHIQTCFNETEPRFRHETAYHIYTVLYTIISHSHTSHTHAHTYTQRHTHAHTHICKHTYTHTCTNKRIHKHTYTDRHTTTHINAHMHAHKHVNAHTYIRVHARTHARKHIRAHTHMYTHKYKVHARTRMYTQKPIYTHTCTRTVARIHSHECVWNIVVMLYNSQISINYCTHSLYELCVYSLTWETSQIQTNRIPTAIKKSILML